MPMPKASQYVSAISKYMLKHQKALFKPPWPGDCPLLDYHGYEEAANEYMDWSLCSDLDVNDDEGRIKAFRQWQEKHLTPKAIHSINSAIRQRVLRARGEKGVTITLSQSAYAMLVELAQHDGLPLSEALESRLKRQYTRMKNQKNTKEARTE